MAKIGCAKCGGTKKMALGGSAVKKAPVQLYGIPQQNMGTSSQMGFGKKGGTLNEMARGGTKKSSSAKIVQQFTRKTLSDKALAARTAGANKANAGKIASKSNLPAKTIKPGLPAKTIKVAAKAPVKAPTKVLTIAQMKALEVAKKASTGSKAVGTGLKVMSKVPAKVAKINFTEVAKKGGKNWKKLAGYAAIGAGAYALDSYNNSKTTKPAAKPKVKPGTNKGALSKIVTPNKVGDNVKVTPKPVTPKPIAKSSGSTKKYTSPNTGTTTIINTKPNGEKQTKVTTYGGQSSYKSTHVNPKGSPVLDKVKKAAEDAKGNKAGDGSSLKRPTNLKPTTKTDTNANGTKTTIYTDASGNRHVKVVKKDGTTFTSNDTPKAATTPKVETKKTTTTPKKTTPKVTAKVADEVTKMETKRPSTIETKNPADLKIIEPATKTSSTSSSSTPSSSTSTTVPRANVINRVRGAINESRERRAVRAEARGDEEKATKLRDKEKATQAKMMKKGGSVKSLPKAQFGTTTGQPKMKDYYNKQITDAQYKKTREKASIDLKLALNKNNQNNVNRQKTDAINTKLKNYKMDPVTNKIMLTKKKGGAVKSLPKAQDGVSTGQSRDSSAMKNYYDKQLMDAQYKEARKKASSNLKSALNKNNQNNVNSQKTDALNTILKGYRPNPTTGKMMLTKKKGGVVKAKKK